MTPAINFTSGAVDNGPQPSIPVNSIGTPSFSGHETFPFRYAWLPKAVRATEEDTGIFGREDAMVRLGVGK
ncbi:DUF4007 family protein, partial [bacterium]|nr:DUF4007 family protein [bacterium]